MEEQLEEVRELLKVMVRAARQQRFLILLQGFLIGCLLGKLFF